MSRIVTLHVYSQRADPYWILSKEDERNLAQLLRSLEERSLFKAQGGVSTTGYRGFSLSLPSDRGPVMVNQGIVDPGSFELSFVDKGRAIERFLLDTAGESVPASLKEEVQRALSRSVEELWEERTRPPSDAAVCTPNAEDAPRYDPGAWNNNDFVRRRNNCYNYALDKPLNNGAIPGSTNGVSIVYSDCKAPKGPLEAATADKLIAVSDFSRKLSAGEGWYVALALKHDFTDCHWYRQDASGCWSHKLGVAAASDRDDSKNFITDPEHCNRGVYSQFCTYMIAGPDVDIELEDFALSAALARVGFT